MAKEFPKAWKYLNTWKKELVKRDNGDLDDDTWYRFSRSQSLDRVGFVKLLAAGTVRDLQFSFDPEGDIFLTGGRVDGIVPANGIDPMFLLGVLNSSVANFVFHRIGRVKAGGFFEANKQFIAPLPVPDTDADASSKIGEIASALFELRSHRRDVLTSIRRRTETLVFRARPPTWLFPSLRTKAELANDVPKHLDTAEQEGWVDQKFDESLAAKHDELSTRLLPSATLEARFASGELSFLIDGVPVVDHIFLDESEGAFVLAQWRVLAQTFAITEKTNGAKLAKALSRIGTSENQALVDQIVKLEHDLAKCDIEVSALEQRLEEACFIAYELTHEERALVLRETGG